MIALYHRVYRRENFEKAAKDLFALIYRAQKEQPDLPRVLYVDIDGHQNETGGYDEDMQELQIEFGMQILLPFVKELHFPLGTIKNPKEQRNDIPEKIIIGNERNDRDGKLEELYIENYSNTEFLSEDDVYEYMRKVSDFLRNYNETFFMINEREPYDPFGWLCMWRMHIKNLSIELFNSFIHGNFLSVSAMTRALMECYVYLKILKTEGNEQLIHEWFLCNLIHKAVDKNGCCNESLKEIVKEYCQKLDISFDEKWKFYTETATKESGWLRNVMGKERISFRTLCNRINEGEIYSDYENACAYIHGQDIATKLHPFTFYSTIYSKLYMMMIYIFKSIRLFETNEEFEDTMVELEEELIDLGEGYLESVVE